MNPLRILRLVVLLTSLMLVVISSQASTLCEETVPMEFRASLKNVRRPVSALSMALPSGAREKEVYSDEGEVIRWRVNGLEITYSLAWQPSQLAATGCTRVINGQQFQVQHVEATTGAQTITASIAKFKGTGYLLTIVIAAPKGKAARMKALSVLDSILFINDPEKVLIRRIGGSEAGKFCVVLREDGSTATLHVGDRISWDGGKIKEILEDRVVFVRPTFNLSTQEWDGVIQSIRLSGGT